MEAKLGHIEIGDEIIGLLEAYKIPLRNFAVELKFATTRYNHVCITLEYFPENLVSGDPIAQKIDFQAMANELGNTLQGFDFPTDMFGLTTFVKSKDFDLLAEKNPLLAERDILGQMETKNSVLVWYIQIIRLLDHTQKVGHSIPAE